MLAQQHVEWDFAEMVPLAKGCIGDSQTPTRTGGKVEVGDVEVPLGLEFGILRRSPGVLVEDGDSDLWERVADKLGR